MNEYKESKVVLKKFLQEKMSLADGQVFRAPPKVTDINLYPIIVIRSATSRKTVADSGFTKNDYNILVGIYTRAETSLDASDELDGMIKQLDNAVKTYGAAGLDATNLIDSRWEDFTRLEENTTYADSVADDLGWVVYGVSLGVRIREAMSSMTG